MTKWQCNCGNWNLTDECVSCGKLKDCDFSQEELDCATKCYVQGCKIGGYTPSYGIGENAPLAHKKCTVAFYRASRLGLQMDIEHLKQINEIKQGKIKFLQDTDEFNKEKIKQLEELANSLEFQRDKLTSDTKWLNDERLRIKNDLKKQIDVLEAQVKNLESQLKAANNQPKMGTGMPILGDKVWTKPMNWVNEPYVDEPAVEVIVKNPDSEGFYVIHPIGEWIYTQKRLFSDINKTWWWEKPKD